MTGYRTANRVTGYRTANSVTGYRTAAISTRVQRKGYQHSSLPLHDVGMQDHNKLHVWQRAHALTLTLHAASKLITHRNAPGLRAQLLRASGSISANIAEGAGQDSSAQFARFLTIAIASANELENHLTLARDLALMEGTVAANLQRDLKIVRKMLYGLRRRVQGLPVTGNAVRSVDSNL